MSNQPKLSFEHPTVLAQRIERVLALHSPDEPRTGIGVRSEHVCAECSQWADRFDEVEWPCETVRILKGDDA